MSKVNASWWCCGLNLQLIFTQFGTEPKVATEIQLTNAQHTSKELHTRLYCAVFAGATQWAQVHRYTQALRVLLPALAFLKWPEQLVAVLADTLPEAASHAACSASNPLLSVLRESSCGQGVNASSL